MYEDENWQELAGETLEGFMEQVEKDTGGTIDNDLKPSLDTTKVEFRQLPFYDNAALVRLTDVRWSPSNLKIYFLTEGGNLYRLDGKSHPIHDINARAPIKVTDDNVLDYLRFFCFFVRGDEGPFLIVEDMNDPNLPELDEATRNAFENSIRDASYEGKNEESHWLCDGIVFYSNALFIANFEVQPNGMISMLSDDSVLRDLPVRVDRPIKQNDQ